MAALSPGTGTLIAARVVQGAGAAVLVPLTLTLISEAFPAEKRGAAIGIWGGITGLGVAAGPVVGGAIVAGHLLAVDLLAQRPGRAGRRGAVRRCGCARAAVPARSSTSSGYGPGRGRAVRR